MRKKMAAAGLAAGLVAGAGAGLVLELSGSAGAAGMHSVATDDTADTTSDDTTTDSGRPDHAAHLQEVLQPLVDDGTITQAQADAVIAALETASPMGGHDGHGGPGGRGLDVVADTLGLTTDEVRTAVHGGQTLAELAVANGKTAQDLVDAMVAEMKAHLDEEVAAGDLTQEQADLRLLEATERITEQVNNTQAVGPAMGRRMGPGHHDDLDDDSTVETSGS